jgi:hypothetical protein
MKKLLRRLAILAAPIIRREIQERHRRSRPARGSVAVLRARTTPILGTFDVRDNGDFYGSLTLMSELPYNGGLLI